MGNNGQCTSSREVARLHPAPNRSAAPSALLLSKRTSIDSRAPPERKSWRVDRSREATVMDVYERRKVGGGAGVERTSLESGERRVNILVRLETIYWRREEKLAV